MVKVHTILSRREQRKPLTAAYIRVSTKKEEQDGSFEAQKKYYENLIRSNPEWDFAGLYCEKASGTKLDDRPVFKQLVQDAVDEKVDLIICKSLSRWARNTVDALEAIEILKSNNVRILFEEENIDTNEFGMIMRVAMGSAVAQQESRSISENIKWTYRNRAKKGIYIAQRGKYFGYNTDDGKFTPDGNAKYVQEIFEQYLQGQSAQSIADMLKAKGVMTTRGNYFTRDAVRGILKNEVYVGDIRFQKSPSVDVITGKPDKDQIERYEKNHHAAIIDRELWDNVQEKLHTNRCRRSQCVSNRQRILELLKKDGSVTANEICVRLDLDVNEVRYLIREMKEKGMITREGVSRNGIWIPLKDDM